MSVNYNSSGSSITHCRFDNNLNVSASVIKNPAVTTPTTFEYDTIVRNGCVPGYGGRGSWHAMGVVVNAGNNVHIKHCDFDSTGYAAIIFGSAGNFAEYNIIRHAMATLVDGAAIYTNCDSTTFTHNIILNTIGNWDGSPFLLDGGNGIWPEFLSHFKGQRIEYNTCAYNHHGNGIFLPNNFNSVIKGNVCYDNATGMHAEGGFYTNDNLPMYDSIISNIFYTLDTTGVAFSYRPEFSYGYINGNYYCNPNSANVICQYGMPTGNIWECAPHPISWWAGNWTQYDKSARTDPIKRPANPASGDLTGTSKLLINEMEPSRAVPIGGNGIYVTVDNQEVSGSVTLEPYHSAVLVHMGRTTSTFDRDHLRRPDSRLGIVQSGERLSLRLPQHSSAHAVILDSKGRVVAVLSDPVGARESLTWKGAAGVYRCVVRISREPAAIEETRQFVVR